MGRLALAMVLVAAQAWMATASLAAETPGDKGPTYRRNRGQIVFSSDGFVDPATEKDFTKMVRKARRTTRLKLGPKGRWDFNFIAFLRQAPRANKVNLVWYRLGKKREQVDFVEFVVQPNGFTLRAKTTLSQAQFKPGDKIEGRITRLIGGREKVYAKCRFTLTK